MRDEGESTGKAMYKRCRWKVGMRNVDVGGAGGDGFVEPCVRRPFMSPQYIGSKLVGVII